MAGPAQIAECARMESSNFIMPDGCGAFTCLMFFVAGVVVLAVVEALLALYLLKRLVLNTTSSASASSVQSDLKIQQSEDFSIRLQGDAWVAPVPEKMDFSKVIVKRIRKDKKKEKDCGQKEKDVLEIAPVRRHAVLKSKALVLRAPDGTVEKVSLEGCEVKSVSSSPGESRKWGKKFPIKLHHPDRPLYRGSKTFLFYAQSGYAKEAWCEAFRAMAATSSSLSKWTFGTKRGYREYTSAAEENMPYLTKFYAVDGEDRLTEVIQKEENAEGPSKKRIMWRKLARKASMGRDQKEARFAHAVDEVQRRKQPRLSDGKAWKNKENAFYDDDSSVSGAESVTPVVDPNFDRDISFEKLENGESNDTSSARIDRESGDQVPATEQKARKSKEGKEIEQGVLCVNMIVARLYYDFNRSERRLAGVNRFFQRLIMKIRKPSYVKSISIKELDLGRHPPFATAMRILPSDAGGALAMEVDLEWLGGGHLTCETRLDLREQSTEGEVAAQLAESGSEGDAAAGLLKGLQKDFDSAASSSGAVQEERQSDLPNKKGRWGMPLVKSMLSRVKDQVSQVPIALKIRLVSLRGTVVLKLKAPPSDRVWFAFKTMPDIHFEPEPCIGMHRISSGALARLIANQMKIQIRESVVLPYCEDFFLNWMMADKENWLPQSTFPFPFFDSTEREAFRKNDEAHSSSSDESVRPVPRSLNPRNAQSKPPKAKACRSGVPPPSKSQKYALAQPSTSAQGPNPDALQPRRSTSDLSSLGFSGRKPPRSARAEHLNAQASVPNPLRVRSSAFVSNPVQAFGPSALSVTSPLLNKESSKSDFMRPLLKADESSKDEEWESARDLDLRTVRTAMDTRPKDCSSHSEGSASESDVQFLATQVANPDDVKELDHHSKLTSRGRMASLGKKMHTVVEKFHHKRPDDRDGSS